MLILSSLEDTLKSAAAIIGYVGVIIATTTSLYTTFIKKINLPRIGKEVEGSNMSRDSKSEIITGLKRRRYLLAILSGTTFVLAIYCIYISNLSLQARLISNQSELFYLPDSVSSNHIEFARVIPTDKALQGETSLSNTFAKTEQSFWILTTSFGLSESYEDDIDSCLRRGVKFQIMLFDTSQVCYHTINSHVIFAPTQEESQAIESKIYGNLKKSLFLIRNLKKRARDNNYKGDIELRLLHRPMYYQVWVKDAEGKSGLIHLNIYDYNGFKPAFRITSGSSPRLFERVKDEYRAFWNTATPVPL